jgi:Flp pilus assembly protein TadG
MDKSKIRNQKGAAVTGLVLALFMFIMLMGFFTFDSSRIQMAQRELTATCDAASLAGTAMLTSYQIDNDDSGNTKLINAQNNATMYAANMFRAGNLLGQQLTGATTVSTYAATLATGAPGTTKFMVALADPLNNYAPVAPTSPACLNGRAVMVYAGYTYQPVFLSIVGVGTVGLNAMSGGGLPQVDAVLVFDYSGSMDDATMVTFVRTVWDPTKNNTSGLRDYYADPVNGTLNKGVVNYIEIPPPTSGADSHRLSQYLNFNYPNNPNGSSLNVLPPMRMELSDSNDSLATPHFIMDYNLQINTLPYTTVALNPAALNVNWRNTRYNPPGNCTLVAPNGYGKVWAFPAQLDCQNNVNRMAAYDPNTCPLTQLTPRVGGASASVNERPLSPYIAHDTSNVVSNRCYTDIVVNIGNPGSWPYTQPLNGPNTFVDTSNFTFPTEEPDSTLRGQAFRFENIGVLVAASRGNLDSAASLTSATGGTGAGGSIIPSVYTAYGSASVPTNMTTAKCKVGYQRAYTRLAMLYSQPIATALDGADGGFFQKISALTDCRFGFVGFSNSSDMASPPSINSGTYGSHHDTTDGSRENSCYISPRFISRLITHSYLGTNVNAENNIAVSGGSGTGFRQPRRRLAKADSAVNSVGAVAGCRSTSAIAKAPGVCAAWSDTTNLANGLDNGRPLDNTDTYEAMSTARRMFKNGSNYDLAGVTNNRPAAKHAIVFFSDGVPTGGTTSSEASGALSEATSCKTDGIAIYAIGLDVTSNPSLQGAQVTFMGNSGGLADKGGNGGRFFQCTDASQVKDAFAAVARRLSQGQR